MSKQKPPVDDEAPPTLHAQPNPPPLTQSLPTAHAAMPKPLPEMLALPKQIVASTCVAEGASGPPPPHPPPPTHTMQKLPTPNPMPPPPPPPLPMCQLAVPAVSMPEPPVPETSALPSPLEVGGLESPSEHEPAATALPQGRPCPCEDCLNGQSPRQISKNWRDNYVMTVHRVHLANLQGLALRPSRPVPAPGPKPAPPAARRCEFCRVPVAGGFPWQWVGGAELKCRHCFCWQCLKCGPNDHPQPLQCPICEPPSPRSPDRGGSNSSDGGPNPRLGGSSRGGECPGSAGGGTQC